MFMLIHVMTRCTGDIHEMSCHIYTISVSYFFSADCNKRKWFLSSVFNDLSKRNDTFTCHNTCPRLNISVLTI